MAYFKMYGGRIVVQYDGKTILPTDDIQTWLKCGGIKNKSYTTLSQVLADTTTLLALINNNNASDYLVRSTTWASGMTSNSTAMTDIGANDYCAETLLADSTWRTAILNSSYWESVLTFTIPAMTSNTEPQGYVASGSAETLYHDYWYAFDNSWSDSGDVVQNLQNSSSSPFTVMIQLPRDVLHVKVAIVNLIPSMMSAPVYWHKPVTGVVQSIYGSVDGSNWTSIGSHTIANNGDGEFTLNTYDGNKYRYYKYYTPKANSQAFNGNYLSELYRFQIWGR